MLQIIPLRVCDPTLLLLLHSLLELVMHRLPPFLLHLVVLVQRLLLPLFANPSSCNHRIVQQGVSTVRHNKVQQNTPPKTHARKHTPTDSGSSLPPNSLLIDSGKHADTMVDLLLFRLLRTQCPNVSSTTVHAAVSCD